MTEQLSETVCNKAAVMARLSSILDPELDVDIVSLGLIYKVSVTRAGAIKILMTLTSPGCPLAGSIEAMIRASMIDLVSDTDEDVHITVTFDPPWTPDMMSEEVRLEYGMPPTY
jgi:metal-sulfur cluster biosynthetic enzyme